MANRARENGCTILGIETSCDETAAALVHRSPDGRGTVLADLVLSQAEAHSLFGGVVPEIAARAHVEALDGLIAEACRRAGIAGRGAEEIDAIAATAGPGLIGGLLVGTMTAKAIAAAWNRPYLAINHLEGHALTARLTDGVAYPYLLLLVSGGHSQILRVAGLGRYERLATTIDDALGEAFDKTAKLLDLGYPGGPVVERAAASGDPARFTLPRPLAGAAGLDMSFSGLKTAVRTIAERHAPLDDRDIADLCAGFQAAIVDVLTDRVDRILSQEQAGTATAFVAAGGVAANQAIRAALKALCHRHGVPFVAPPPALCTDNAAMIAWAGAERLAAGLTDGTDSAARPRWPLDALAAPMIGSGRKGPRA